MRLTREGKKFLIAAALIAVAALNTGNNLIYLILSMMLSLFVIAFAALRLNLKGVSLDVSHEGHLYAKERSNIKVSVSNSKRLLPSYSLRLLPPDGNTEAVMQAGLIPYVGPKATASEAVSVLFPRRGLYGYGDFSIESGFPFIFAKGRLRPGLKKDLVVFPEIKDVSGVLGFSERGDRESLRRGDSEEMLYIRQFRHGDDFRAINWKATARADKLMVKERASSEAEGVTIVLDDAPYGAGGTAFMGGGTAAFEKAVSFAASAAVSFIREGSPVGLVSVGERMRIGTGRGHLHELLRTLALINDNASGPLPSEDEISGRAILVLKSPGSPLERLSAVCDLVVYADKT